MGKRGKEDARRCWAGGRDWARPAKQSEAWEKAAGRALGKKAKRATHVGRPRRAELGRKPNEADFPFSFSFLVFQNHFPKDFEIHFEFNSNHSIQNFKCSSMNAQSCFYPYI
jgi:hypothetical protein